MFGKFLFHARAFYNLQLMKLDGTYRKFIYHVACIKHHLPGLSRKTQYEMHTDIDAPFCRHPYGTPGCLEVMTPVYTEQCSVVT